MCVTSTVAPILALVCIAGSASAQTADRGNVWSLGTTATGVAGVATDGSRSGPAIGGAVGWEMTPRFAVQGDAAWVELGDGITTFSASLKARVRMPGSRPIDPFFNAGIGFARTSLSVDTRRPPQFYERRMGRHTAPGGPVMTFTDPTLVLGGGVNIFVNRHFAIRPALDATVVLRDRRHYVVTTAALQAVFHFEDRPVTPSSRTFKRGGRVDASVNAGNGPLPRVSSDRRRSYGS
jgi:outer membrane protein with beta-barrel domain